MGRNSQTAVKTRLSEEFGYEHAILFGRARSALAALLEMLLLHARFDILIPTNVCSALLSTCWASGGRCRLLPVDRTTGIVSDATLAAAIGEGGAGIAIATQLYGYRRHYSLAKAAARDRGWFFLENDTLLTGARSVAPRANAFADAALVSFGYGKTIELGGGGVILTSDSALAGELERRAARYPCLDAAAEQTEINEMHRRRSLRNGGSKASGEALLLTEMSEIRYGFPQRLVTPLSQALDCLPKIVEGRRRRAELWNRALAPFGERMLAPPGEPTVPWRVIRRVPSGRDRMVSALRGEGFDVGTNFPALADEHPQLLAKYRDADATAWGREVINLWVSKDYDARRIRAVAGVIGYALQQSGVS